MTRRQTLLKRVDLIYKDFPSVREWARDLSTTQLADFLRVWLEKQRIWKASRLHSKDHRSTPE